MPELIDLRSDTVTLPTPAMRRAMAEAEVGDDVFHEDPTINRLEEMAAERCGKEAGLFVASGSMGNLVALLTHCGRGHELLVGAATHMFVQEQGGMAALGGIHGHPIDDMPTGMMSLTDIEEAFHPDDDHLARTRLISLENTHNMAGGRVLPLDYLEQVGRIAADHGVAVHVDGARLFNAAVALGVPVSALMACADSASFCLSKGLACPVGSLLVGSADFIVEARRNRKLVGGGMRQAGILAAAGIVALNEMVDRLHEDHLNAKALAEGLAEIPGFEIDPRDVETNILFVKIVDPRVDPSRLAAELQDQGIRIAAGRSPRIRLVTHYGIERADIERVLTAISRAVGAAARAG
jgi:threonine aldolase